MVGGSGLNGNGSGPSWRRRGSGAPPWKPRCGGDGVRRHPFPGMSRYRAVVRGGSRPSEEAIRETVEIPLEACPECGGPLEDRATHEPVQVDIPEVRPVVTRFRTESGYCRRCRKRVRSRHPLTPPYPGPHARIELPNSLHSPSLIILHHVSCIPSTSTRSE
jgi:hypothetical protein